ncbi:coiled-coil domain-containing protein 106-like [Rhinichthys klamathensis goyatoka]|uniref:coiled-coil domain-containing protein 106-like n=1 Tax=Rhinichthys klamathensis goyatoka TaxID=3034132 RepID=UPI0024B49976|nr:coiled-coil domain-containing protein 106-like [Rhinichthys klamathensis goyatoka]
MKPIKQEILMWQNKAEVLQNKVKELEALNSELRQQVVELSAQQNDLIPRTSVAHEETGAVDLSSDGNTSTDVESSVTEESCDDSSSSSSSEGTRQRRKTKKSKNKKNKSKKHKKNKRKDKNEYDKIKRANNVRDVLRRYKRLLKLTRRGATMTKAFRKEGVSRNAVAQLAPIAELYFADRVQFNSISFTPGKLAEFAEKCREHIVGDVKEKVLAMKIKGSLLPFCLNK